MFLLKTVEMVVSFKVIALIPFKGVQAEGCMVVVTVFVDKNV